MISCLLVALLDLGSRGAVGGERLRLEERLGEVGIRVRGLWGLGLAVLALLDWPWVV